MHQSASQNCFGQSSKDVNKMGIQTCTYRTYRPPISARITFNRLLILISQCYAYLAENLGVEKWRVRLPCKNCSLRSVASILSAFTSSIFRPISEWLFISHFPPNHCQILLVHPESIDLAEMLVRLHRPPQGLVKATAAAHVAVVRGTCTGDATTSLTQSGAGLANSLPGTRTTLPWRSARKAAG